MSRTKRYSAFVLIGAALMLTYGLFTLGQSSSQAKLPEAPPVGFFGSYRVAAEKMDPSRLPIIAPGESILINPIPS